MNKFDVIVVGAGASGLVAASRAAELGARVLVLEKMKAPGRKLLITGKGRCNITNNSKIADFISDVQPNGKFLRNAFSQFFSPHMIELLENYGVQTVLERGGRYFPVSQRAKDVVDALMQYAYKFGVKFLFNHADDSIIYENEQLRGVMCGKTNFYAQSVILTAGGKSYPATGSTGDGYQLAQHVGHTIAKPQPSLVPLITDSKFPARMGDLTLKNINATLWVDGKKAKAEFGEMTFIPDGLSGPVILTLSRHAVEALNNGSKVSITVDLKPALDEQKLDKRLLRDLNEDSNKMLKTVFMHWLPAIMVPVVLDILKLDAEKPCHQLLANERKKIKHLFKNLQFNVVGVRPWSEAIVTAGGVVTCEIKPATMESKIVRNLYIAGELLDLDAPTGGYNLQIAWSTGWVAGASAAANKTKD